LHKSRVVRETQPIFTVPRAKRADATLNFPRNITVAVLNVASGRFARGTVLLSHHFLCKAPPGQTHAPEGGIPSARDTFASKVRFISQGVFVLFSCDLVGSSVFPDRSKDPRTYTKQTRTRKHLLGAVRVTLRLNIGALTEPLLLPDFWKRAALGHLFVIDWWLCDCHGPQVEISSPPSFRWG